MMFLINMNGGLASPVDVNCAAVAVSSVRKDIVVVVVGVVIIGRISAAVVTSQDTFSSGGGRADEFSSSTAIFSFLLLCSSSFFLVSLSSLLSSSLLSCCSTLHSFRVGCFVRLLLLVRCCFFLLSCTYTSQFASRSLFSNKDNFTCARLLHSALLLLLVEEVSNEISLSIYD